MTKNEIKGLLENNNFPFTINDEIGKGSYGNVYSTDNGKAIKVVDMNHVIANTTENGNYQLSKKERKDLENKMEREALVNATLRDMANTSKCDYSKHLLLADDARGIETDGDKQCFIYTMKRMSGNLVDFMIANEFRELDAIKIGISMAKAMCFYNRYDVLHRDIKPSNIMFLKENSGGVIFKLGDFGISKFKIAASNTLGVGTPDFIAPEHNKTIAADIYSLGVTLDKFCSNSGYEFKLGSSTLASSELNVIITKMTESDLNVRYKTPEEVLVALEQLYNIRTRKQNQPSTKTQEQVELEKKELLAKLEQAQQELLEERLKARIQIEDSKPRGVFDIENLDLDFSESNSSKFKKKSFNEDKSILEMHQEIVKTRVGLAIIGGMLLIATVVGVMLIIDFLGNRQNVHAAVTTLCTLSFLLIALKCIMTNLKKRVILLFCTVFISFFASISYQPNLFSTPVNAISNLLGYGPIMPTYEFTDTTTLGMYDAKSEIKITHPNGSIELIKRKYDS